MGVLRELRAFFAASLITPVALAPRESSGDQLRRRIVVALTLVAGTATLGWALTIQPGDPWFYAATLAAAGVWTVGALVSGPLHFGHSVSRNGNPTLGVVQGLVLGATLLAIFVMGALVVGRVPVLRQPVMELLDHARFGSVWLVALITVINGAAEELFFRGAVYAALPAHTHIVGTTVIYAASTLLTGVPLLTFAAVCLGLLTAAQRRVTGGVLGPIVSHLTWSLGMLFLLPPVLSLGG